MKKYARQNFKSCCFVIAFYNCFKNYLNKMFYAIFTKLVLLYLKEKVEIR